jgi:hypothetical protein
MSTASVECFGQRTTEVPYLERNLPQRQFIPYTLHVKWPRISAEPLSEASETVRD